MLYLKVHAGNAIAAKYSVDFQTTFDRILALPNTGSPRPRLGRRTRCVRVDPYLVFYDYDPSEDVVKVLRVIHSSRKITRAGLMP
jgi:plasmid stabilization system protein ParE